MGGYGSGRSREHPVLYEDTCRLDVRSLRKHGGLEAGSQYPLYWCANGRLVGKVWIEVRSECIMVGDQYQHRGDFFRIQLEKTACHFGGYRPWFTCPKCGCRCLVLISCGGIYVCRGCLRTPYRSQRMSAHDRAVERCNRAEQRLRQAQAQRGVHRRTISRLEHEYEIRHLKALEAFIASSKKFFTREAWSEIFGHK